MTGRRDRTARLASNGRPYRDQGMAGYVTDDECVRYRMKRDMGYDRIVHPRHPRRYEYRDGCDCGWLLIVPFIVLFAYVFWMMLHPSNWWMW